MLLSMINNFIPSLLVVIFDIPPKNSMFHVYPRFKKTLYPILKSLLAYNSQICLILLSSEAELFREIFIVKECSISLSEEYMAYVSRNLEE